MSEVKAALAVVDQRLAEFSGYSVAWADPAWYYQQPSVVTAHKGDIIVIQIKIPILNELSTLTMYRVLSFPIPPLF